LNQPLGSITANAETAELILGWSMPDLTEVREILADIRLDDCAPASDPRLRSSRMRRGFEPRTSDVN